MVSEDLRSSFKTARFSWRRWTLLSTTMATAFNMVICTSAPEAETLAYRTIETRLQTSFKPYKKQTSWNPWPWQVVILNRRKRVMPAVSSLWVIGIWTGQLWMSFVTKITEVKSKMETSYLATWRWQACNSSKILTKASTAIISLIVVTIHRATLKSKIKGSNRCRGPAPTSNLDSWIR